LVALEKSDRKIIIPILHKISLEEAANFYPGIIARKAISSDKQLEEIVLMIEERISGAKIARQVGDPLLKKFAAVADRFALRALNERIGKSEEGVKLVKAEVARLFEIFWKRLDQVQGPHTFKRTKKEIPPVYVRISGLHAVTVQIQFENFWSNDTADDVLKIESFTPDYDYPTTQDQKNMIALREYKPRFSIDRQVVWYFGA
jgi:hypothetical protein